MPIGLSQDSPFFLLIVVFVFLRLDYAKKTRIFLHHVVVIPCRESLLLLHLLTRMLLLVLLHGVEELVQARILILSFLSLFLCAAWPALILF